MHRDQFITELASELGLPDFEFNSENVARLVVDDQIVIDMEYVEESDHIHVFSSLGTLASDVDVLREVLSANLFGRGTGGATLALDVEQDELLLCHTTALATLDIPRFAEFLHAFSQTAFFWTERLAGIDSSDALAEAVDESTPSDVDFLRV